MMMTTNPPAPPVMQAGPRGEVLPPARPVAPATWWGMVWALVKKEARELALWALVAMAVLGVALAFALYQVADRRYYNGAMAITNEFRNMLVMVPTVVAAVFGFVQFYFEMRPGR